MITLFGNFDTINIHCKKKKYYTATDLKQLFSYGILDNQYREFRNHYDSRSKEKKEPEEKG